MKVFYVQNEKIQEEKEDIKNTWGGDYLGCPERYYKEALQSFAHALYFESDKKKAKQLLHEESVEKLENEIVSCKEYVNEKDFIFDAGMACGILYETSNRDDGCDGFNACLGGLNDFEEFIKKL